MIKHPKRRYFLINIDLLFKLSANHRSFMRTRNQGSASYADQYKHCQVYINHLEEKMRFVIASVLVFFISSVAIAQTDEETRNLETLRLWGEVWDKGKYELVPELVAPTYTRHEPTGTRVVTREQYAENIKSLRNNHAKFTVHALSADRDLIWVRWSLTFTDPKSSKEVQSRGMQVYRFEDGKLAETWFSITRGQGPWSD